MIRALCSIIKAEDLITGALAKNHCTFKLGGELEYLVCPKSVSDFCNYISQLTSLEIPFKVIGFMSNILPSDNLNLGVYITTKYIADQPQVFSNRITAYCGNSLASVCKLAAENCLGGLENLIGIPATVGGAVYNNAGAFGSCIADNLESLLVYTGEKFVSVSAEKAELGYRKSSFQTNKHIIVSATFRLQSKSKEQILGSMQQVVNLRNAKQPKLASAGSVFKKHGNISAGYYMDQAGLKNTTIGGAQISNIHANFIVNLGNATSNDVKQLISLAQQKVKQKFNILLQKEIEILGDFNENISRLPHS